MIIKLEMLSKKTLVRIAKATSNIPQDVLVKVYRGELGSQLTIISKQLEAIEKAAKDKKPSSKEYQALVKKENRLVRIGNAKLKILKELENAAK